MHIVLVHQAFASMDEPGGTRHHELSRYIAGQGNQITIITSPISYLTGRKSKLAPRQVEKVVGENPDEGEITIIRSYAYPALHRSFVHRTINFFSFMFSSFLVGLSVRSVDLIWGTSPPIFQAVTAWALARLKRVPFLLEIRDLWPAFAVQVGILRNPAIIRASEWLERFLYRRADLLVINSPGFLEHVKARGAGRVEIVPNGSDTEMFDPECSGAELRQRYNINDKFIVLYAGAHGVSNDLGIILDAAVELKSEEDIVFVFLGDGKEKINLIKRADELGLNNVLFIPPVVKEDIPETLAAADACIAILKPIPLYATVYPNKVFDYMAAGKPVILAIDGVIKEVIEQSKAGIATPPGDSHAVATAVITLFNDRVKAKEYGENGRIYVSQYFNRKQLAASTLQIMRQLINADSNN
jgi:glycosyltransferase involved in cell wall biosynthesis